MYQINGVVRKLYPRECARLMGFPDTFQLAESQEQNYKQFGNSVVVEVIQLITKEIGKILPRNEEVN
jgi:DNA (cytosine-5)-methyltransferase 1